ncbi:MAG: transcription antitermination factor NusB, partial [Oscillospiraceae bacterium]|nr:transcription antitermination factor NusB [Oscillospiraceae bacterium]
MTDRRKEQASGISPRELALYVMLEVSEKGGYSHIILRDLMGKYQYLEKRDRAFLSRLCEGTLEQQLRMDEVLNRFSSVPVKKMKPVIRNILRLGVYQLLFMDSVPDSAVCNESVKLAVKKGFAPLKGFVNGVLRSIARNKEEAL